jgi:hypothetical protein
MTFSYRDGRCFKIDGNGTLVIVAKEAKDPMNSRILEAINLSNHQATDNCEVHRTITSKGTITRYFRDGTFQLMRPSGYMEESSKGDYFKAVYPDGRKYLVQPKQEDKKLVERIPSKSALDPETGTTFTSRADGLLVFRFMDGGRLTVFPDGTRVRCSANKSKLTIEHPSHDPVTIDADHFRARNPSVVGVGSAFASKGRENLFERTYDGRVMSLALADGGRLRVYKEMRELEGYNNFRLVAVTLLDAPNQVVVKHENYGEVVYLDRRDFFEQSQTASRLSEAIRVLKHRANGMNTNIHQRKVEQTGVSGPLPFDYFIQLFMPTHERSGGVYTVDLNKGELLIKDFESNEFKISKNAQIQSNISVSFNLNSQKPVWDDFPTFEGSEYLEKVNMDLPVPKVWLPPALAVVERDGNAKVLHSENMLEDYFAKKLLDDSFVLERENRGLKSTDISVITKTETEHNNQQWKLGLPSAFRGLPQTKFLPKDPEYHTLAFRRLIRFDQLEHVDHTDIESVRQKSAAYQSQREAEEKSWDIYTSSAEEKKTELEYQQRLLVLALQEKNILVYGQSNKAEISNAHNVVFADS